MVFLSDEFLDLYLKKNGSLGGFFILVGKRADSADPDVIPGESSIVTTPKNPPDDVYWKALVLYVYPASTILSPQK